MNPQRRVGLDPAAYTSDKWFQRELDILFVKSWIFAGTLHDVSKAGDYVCLDVGKDPIFIIRDDDGSIKAFHNVCSHRSTVLLSGRGNTGNSIVCGYHCWSYTKGGCLVRIPQKDSQFEKLDKSIYSLRPLALGVYRGMIFVNVDTSQINQFESWIQKFSQYFGPYDVTDLKEVYSVTYDAKANWKLFVENHIESYHLWYAHKNSIIGLDHFNQENYYYDGHWSFYQPTIREGVMAEFEKYIPSKIIAPDSYWYGSGDHLLFPNLAVVTGAKFVATLQAVPIAPDQSSVEIRMFGIPSNGSDAGERYYDEGGSSEEYSVNLEDIQLCEKVQRGMKSSVSTIASYASEYERSIRYFHTKYLDELGCLEY